MIQLGYCIPETPKFMYLPGIPYNYSQVLPHEMVSNYHYKERVVFDQLVGEQAMASLFPRPPQAFNRIFGFKSPKTQLKPGRSRLDPGLASVADLARTGPGLPCGQPQSRNPVVPITTQPIHFQNTLIVGTSWLLSNQ